MKFILKKPLPGIEVGTIYDSAIEDPCTKEQADLELFVRCFGTRNDFFEEVKESKAWKPEEGEEYWCIYGNGSIDEEDWSNDSIDNGRLSFGSIYKTKEEAIKARDKQLAIVRLRNYLIENDMLLSYEEANATGFMSYIAIDRFTKNITSVISESFIGYSPFGNINSYYAEQFIKDCESDLRLIFLP